MATININQTSFSGRSIVISNGKVIIDGVDKTPESKQIEIQVMGDITELKVDHVCNSIEVSGNVGNLNTKSGDIVCGYVTGNIQTMSGDVDCGNVGGNISTMSGDVKFRKA